MIAALGQLAIAPSMSVSLLPFGLVTLALPVVGSMAKVAEVRAAQVPQPMQMSWLMMGCFIDVLFLRRGQGPSFGRGAWRDK